MTAMPVRAILGAPVSPGEIHAEMKHAVMNAPGFQKNTMLILLNSCDSQERDHLRTLADDAAREAAKDDKAAVMAAFKMAGHGHGVRWPPF